MSFIHSYLSLACSLLSAGTSKLPLSKVWGCFFPFPYGSDTQPEQQADLDGHSASAGTGEALPILAATLIGEPKPKWIFC